MAAFAVITFVTILLFYRHYQKKVALQTDQSVGNGQEEVGARQQAIQDMEEKVAVLSLETEKLDQEDQTLTETIDTVSDEVTQLAQNNATTQQRIAANDPVSMAIEAKERELAPLTIADIDDFYKMNKENFDPARLKQDSPYKKISKEKVAKYIEKTKKWGEEELALRKTEREDLETKFKEFSEEFKAKLLGVISKKEKIIKNNVSFVEKFMDELIKNELDWDGFFERLKLVAGDIKETIEKNKYSHIYCAIPGGGSKSNTFMFFMFWKFLKPTFEETKAKLFFIGSDTSMGNQPSDIYDTFFDKAGTFRSKTKGKKLILYFDDQAYAGTQSRIQVEKLPKNRSLDIRFAMIGISHRAKRNITGMDPKKSQSAVFFFDEDYVKGKRSSWKAYLAKGKDKSVQLITEKRIFCRLTHTIFQTHQGHPRDAGR